nr:reverse transcriptase domain-containing protein [Tanacetum cinerariifolium]
MKFLDSLKDSRRHLERHENDLRKCLELVLTTDLRGNLLSKTTREALHIIENKSKFHYSRNKPNVSTMNTTFRKNASKTDDRIDKLADQISTLVDIVSKKVVTPVTVKAVAVEESCVTCGGNLSSNTIPNPKGEMKAIPTRSGIVYEGPLIPTNPSPKKVVERETEETTDKEQTNFQGSTAHIQPPVIPIPEPDVSKTLPKPNIPYPSRLNDQKLHKKATNQMEKFFQIIQDLHFDISFVDALLLMPKFASMIKSLLTNKDKLFKLAKIPLNENCSAMLLKKLPKKLGDPDKFLIPCDFLGIDVCHALADLGVAKDVFVKVGKFHFPTDFVVVDFEADPRVPLILGTSFLRTGRALIDIYGEEITLRVNDEAVTFNLNQTTRYSSIYDDMSVNRIDVIDVTKEEYAQEMLAGSENRPLMLNKENYVPWSSRLLRYAKSRPNGKLIHNSIINGPYVRRMIPEPGDPNREVPTILLGLPEDIYAAVDSCETAQEIWLRVQQMMKGSDIGIQEKKAKLFNEWERFTSNDKESIESYYHHFLKLMNDLKQNKHFPEKIASNLKFLNNLQPEWSRHVTIVHQTKDLHIADYTQLYDFLKQNQKEVDGLKAERLARTQDPLALMATSNNPYTFPVLHQDQPSFNQNYIQQPMPNPKDITDPTTTMNMALALMAKAFKLNYSTPTNKNQRISSNLCNRQITQPGMNMSQDRQMQMVGVQTPRIQNVRNQNGIIGVPGNANQNPNGNGNLVAARAEGNATGHNGNQISCYNYRGVGHFARNYTVRPRRRDAAYLQTQLLIAQKEEAGIQLQAKEFDLMAAVADLDEIEEVNANCILMANLQQASTSGTQTDKAPVYDSYGSAEVHNYKDCYDNEIFNMFTQVEQYTELLEPIPEAHQAPQNDNNVIFEVSSVEQSGGTVEQHPANVEETHALYDSLYNNLEIKVEKINTSSSAHQEIHKIVKDKILPIVNQVDARVQNFKIQFLKEVAKFVRDFKSLAKEADESLAKHKALELEIDHLLKAFISQDIISIMQNPSVVETLNL